MTFFLWYDKSDDSTNQERKKLVKKVVSQCHTVRKFIPLQPGGPSTVGIWFVTKEPVISRQVSRGDHTVIVGRQGEHQGFSRYPPSPHRREFTLLMEERERVHRTRVYLVKVK